MIILLVLITALLGIFLFFFCRKVINFVYQIEESKNEEAMYEKYTLFKIISYLSYTLFLVLGILTAQVIILKSWLILYYLIWFLGLFFIQLNLKLINHFLDVLFVKDAVTEIEKDFGIGCIKRKGMLYYFKYRLTGDSFKI